MKKSSVSTLAFAIVFCAFASSAGAQTYGFADSGVTRVSSGISSGSSVNGEVAAIDNNDICSETGGYASYDLCLYAMPLGGCYQCNQQSNGCYKLKQVQCQNNNNNNNNGTGNYTTDIDVTKGSDNYEYAATLDDGDKPFNGNTNSGTTPTNTSKVNCPSNMTASGDCCCVLR